MEDIIKQIEQLAKDKKNYLPLVGAVVGVLLSNDKQNTEKLVNGLIGAGLGYIVKGFMEKK